ncbi:Zinc finger MYND-type [Penicillium sp. DV-2018c]|nr:Zinc finger MYND-type [Penicillium sp. DV-2018c]
MAPLASAKPPSTVTTKRSHSSLPAWAAACLQIATTDINPGEDVLHIKKPIVAALDSPWLLNAMRWLLRTT